MVERYIPEKLQMGDTIRVIAPSWSLSVIDKNVQGVAEEALSDMGFVVTYGEHVHDYNVFRSTSVESRVEDLHNAFIDPSVKGIMTAIGGWNSNQILQYINWDILKENPKVFCGFSDIDALNSAIYSMTGLVTYSGPHFSTFGQKYYSEYTRKYFEKCLMSNIPFILEPSSYWSDDDWYVDQEKRNLIINKGLRVIQEGDSAGIMISSNLCTLSILQGTEFMPNLNDVILFIEEAKFSNPFVFERNLQSLLQQKGSNITGLVIGRFQPNAMEDNQLLQILQSKKELQHIPIIADIDYGHTDPRATLPTGGIVKVHSEYNNSHIEFLEH